MAKARYSVVNELETHMVWYQLRISRDISIDKFNNWWYIR